MSEGIPPDHPSDALDNEAASWVLRCDRGLTPAEQDEFSAWLAADPRHGDRLARHRRHWKQLDALAEWRPEHAARPNPDLLAPPLRVRFRRWRPAGLALAAAAALTFGIYLFRPPTPSESARTTGVVAAGPRVLPDGSKVELNRGATLTVQYTPGERRVKLDRGEAHFSVEHDSQRPFIVNAGGVDVRAVGTAFNVRIDPAAVEVLVTEGKVRVDAAQPASTNTPAPHATLVPVLEARQRAVLPLRPPQAQSAPAPQIATLTPGEIERVLAWQHRLLDFNATPLGEIAAEFNRRNVIQIVVVDPDLAAIPLTATLRSDNIDGFVHLVEVGFGARAEKRGDTAIVLRKAR